MQRRRFTIENQKLANILLSIVVTLLCAYEIYYVVILFLPRILNNSSIMIFQNTKANYYSEILYFAILLFGIIYFYRKKKKYLFGIAVFGFAAQTIGFFYLMTLV